MDVLSALEDIENEFPTETNELNVSPLPQHSSFLIQILKKKIRNPKVMQKNGKKEFKIFTYK